MAPMVKQCATCPFRPGGLPVQDLLVHRVLVEHVSPICHSTGPGALTKRLFAEPRACRGARDLVIGVLYAAGFLEAPTDEAWAKKVKEMGL